MKLAAVTGGAAALAMLATPAYADERYFVWGYNADTPSAGEREIELYMTAKDLVAGKFEHQLSFDYGLTDRWSVEPYLQFAQTGLSSFSASAFKLQSRFRFLDEADWAPALALYGEIQQPFASNWGKLEGKLLGHKNVGPVQLASNFITEQSLTKGTTEFGATFGAALPVTDWLVLAAEAKGSELFVKNKFIAGPTVFFRTTGLYAGVGWGQDLSGAGANQARLRASVEF
jgi:hypothetical protein